MGALRSKWVSPYSNIIIIPMFVLGALRWKCVSGSMTQAELQCNAANIFTFSFSSKLCLCLSSCWVYVRSSFNHDCHIFFLFDSLNTGVINVTANRLLCVSVNTYYMHSLPAASNTKYSNRTRNGCVPPPQLSTHGHKTYTQPSNTTPTRIPHGLFAGN